MPGEVSTMEKDPMKKFFRVDDWTDGCFRIIVLMIVVPLVIWLLTVFAFAQ